MDSKKSNDKEALDKISEFAGVLDATTVKNKKQLKGSWNNELIVNHKEYNRIMSEGKSISIIPDAPEGYKSWYDLYLEWDGKTKSLAYNIGNKLKTIDINLLGQYVILEIDERNEKIIKLNEDLTAENTKFLTDIEGWIAEKIKHENEANRLRVENKRLLTELDKAQLKLQKQRDTWDEYYPLLVDRNKKIEAELTSIKSKWWYKLFNWKWN